MKTSTSIRVAILQEVLRVRLLPHIEPGMFLGVRKMVHDYKGGGAAEWTVSIGDNAEEMKSFPLVLLEGSGTGWPWLEDLGDEIFDEVRAEWLEEMSDRMGA